MKKNSEFTNKKYNNSPLLHGSLPIMRAKVVRNSDPKQIGRVQIRIPSYHGMPGLTDRSIADEDLPWAMPCFPWGCGQDFGSFIVPIPGSFVWVLFEDDDISKPVYFGGVPSVGSKNTKTMNNLDDPDSTQRPWKTIPGEPDTPKDAYKGLPDLTTNRNILYKSQKGHTITLDDTDGEESISIIDRLGQIIKFICGVTPEQNEGGYRRGTRSALSNTQLGEGVVEDPSILMRSGESQDDTPVHSLFQLFRSKIRAESIDSGAQKYTYTDYDPYHYRQQTQSSFVDMSEDHIMISYPGITEYFCSSYYRLTAFDKCVIECGPNGMKIQYDGHGLEIDSNSVKLKYKNTEFSETQDDVSIKANKSFSFKADGAEFGGDKNSLHAKGKEVKFEGSGSIYTEGNKTYIYGTEIHFKKKGS